jgi:hypothetical protein
MPSIRRLAVDFEFQAFLKINLLSVQIHYFVDVVGLSQRFGHPSLRRGARRFRPQESDRLDPFLVVGFE